MKSVNAMEELEKFVSKNNFSKTLEYRGKVRGYNNKSILVKNIF
jgi:hypothetical protein